MGNHRWPALCRFDLFEPHGESAIDGNGYPGHLCVHFLNSRTHGTDRVDEDHQKMILKAYQAG